MISSSIQTLQGNLTTDVEDASEDNVLLQSEQCLGDHVTGGVVHEWTQVQKRLQSKNCTELARLVIYQIFALRYVCVFRSCC